MYIIFLLFFVVLRGTSFYFACPSSILDEICAMNDIIAILYCYSVRNDARIIDFFIYFGFTWCTSLRSDVTLRAYIIHTIHTIYIYIFVGVYVRTIMVIYNFRFYYNIHCGVEVKYSVAYRIYLMMWVQSLSRTIHCYTYTYNLGQNVLRIFLKHARSVYSSIFPPKNNPSSPPVTMLCNCVVTTPR